MPERPEIAPPTSPVTAAALEPPVPIPVGGARARTPREIAWLRFKRHKLALAGLVVLGILLLLAVLAPLLTPFEYSKISTGPFLQGPSRAHWFGTDNIGRDTFTRVLFGGRISLLVGISVALWAGVLGTLVGSLAGYYGGWIDQVLMRITDLFLSIPFLVVLILSVNLLSGTLFDIVLVLSLFFWMPNARIVRGVVLSLKEKEFVEAARSLGASNRRIIFSHILPNALGPIIVVITLGVATAILTESALSFLGFGVQPPTPTWGNLLAGARNFTLIQPAMVWFPGLFILLTVLAVNLVGDGLRDALDPHQELRAREL
jgi:peptide/nickel transport system permease protein